MKYIIYKITIQDYVYIGSTQNLTRRRYEHKSKSNNHFNRLVYNKINELGCWDDCIMVPIEEFECDNKIQAHIREEYFRKEYNSNLNSKYCHADDKRHKEVMKNKNDKFYENHKLEISEKGKNKFTCECGSICRIGDKVRHLKTLKHCEFINNK